jgi:hypothetical protein
VADPSRRDGPASPGSGVSRVASHLALFIGKSKPNPTAQFGDALTTFSRNPEGVRGMEWRKHALASRSAGLRPCG